MIVKNIADYVRHLYSYRELIVNLAVKDFKVRYKSASLGFLWMLLNPVLQMIVLSIVFSLIVRFNLDVPYPLFLLCGLLPWNFFSVSQGAGAHSLVEESNLVKKVYFPREIIPISITLGHLINFVTAMILFLPFPLIICHSYSWNLLFLPIPIALLMLFTLSLTAIVTNLDVFYRDTRYIMDALVMVWFYATPVFYPLKTIHDIAPKLEFLFRINPMACIIEMFRSIILYGQFPSIWSILYVLLITLLLGILTVSLYHRRGPVMADYL